MSLKIKVNAKPLLNDFEFIDKRYMEQARNYVDRLGVFFQSDIKRSMGPPKSGVIYNGHQASAPGEPPAIDSGILVNSISFKKEGALIGKVFTNVDYAERLEVEMNRSFMGKDSPARKNTQKRAKALQPLLRVGRR